MVHLLRRTLTPLPSLHSPQSSPMELCGCFLCWEIHKRFTFPITAALIIRLCTGEDVGALCGPASDHHFTSTVVRWTWVEEESVHTIATQCSPVSSLVIGTSWSLKETWYWQFTCITTLLLLHCWMSSLLELHRQVS